MKGIVASWKADRGFGFIAVPGGNDVFCHITALPNDVDCLRIGQGVEFELSDDDGRPRAVNVEVDE